ncbi:MAG: polyphosphate polymerase domain-containing protein [Gemmataceae bacterium]
MFDEQGAKTSDGDSGAGRADEAIRRLANGVFCWGGADFLSPSLRDDREEPAYEIKFLLDDHLAHAVAGWALSHLHLDPYCGPDHGYRVHGLYFDSPQHDVFHRSPGYRRKKYRLRRYGGSTVVFLEQKRKYGNRVAKRRIQVAEQELPRLAGPEDPAWAGHWYQRRLLLRRLRPACLINYERQAFVGESAEGPLRMTMDRKLSCLTTDQWQVHEVVAGLPLFPGRVVMELKYGSVLPALFKGLLVEFGLNSIPLSKYRSAMQAWHGEALVREVG